VLFNERNLSLIYDLIQKLGQKTHFFCLGKLKKKAPVIVTRASFMGEKN
jgi:hypothetical protein